MVPVSTPAVKTPATPAKRETLANATAAAQAKAIREAMSATHREIAAAALRATSGKADEAAALVGDAVRASVVILSRIVPILRSPAPTQCFIDGNNRGARVGDLFASALGLGAVYRDASKADLAAARKALGDDYRPAK